MAGHNGNILVTQAQAGRAFQVTRKGRVVWSWDALGPLSSITNKGIKLYRLSAVTDDLKLNAYEYL